MKVAKIATACRRGAGSCEVRAAVLKERPAIRGIALPGMPVGAPGMDGPKGKNLDVYTLERRAGASGETQRVFGSF